MFGTVTLYTRKKIKQIKLPNNMPKLQAFLQHLQPPCYRIRAVSEFDHYGVVGCFHLGTERLQHLQPPCYRIRAVSKFDHYGVVGCFHLGTERLQHLQPPCYRIRAVSKFDHYGVVGCFHLGTERGNRSWGNGHLAVRRLRWCHCTKPAERN